LITTPNR